MEKLSSSEIEQYEAMQNSLNFLALTAVASGAYLMSQGNLHLSLPLFAFAATCRKIGQKLAAEQSELDPNNGYWTRLANEERGKGRQR